MKHLRPLAALLCLALCLFSFAGCSARPTSVEYVIGVSLANLREQWRLVLKSELEAEAAKYPNVRLVITDAAGDSEKQAADVERLMNFAVDLLIISPNDAEALTPVISAAYEEIPVIVLDRAVEGYNYTLFIGPDNRLIGRQAGETVLSMLENQTGQVLELKTDAFSSESRSSEFIRELQDAGIQTHSVDLQEATRDCTEDYLLAHPEVLEEIDVIFAHNDYMAYGARLALQQLGREDIRIVGLDGFSGKDGGRKLVEQGLIDATLVCPTGGTEAIRYAMDIMNHQSGVPKQIILRSHPLRAGDALQTGESALPAAPEPSQDVIRVGYAQIQEDSAWRQANQASIQAAAREFGVDLEVALNELSMETQIDQVRAFIQEGVDVIVISPVLADGWVPVLQEAREAGIPVLLTDRMVNAPEDLYTSFIGADFEEEGRRCARWMMRQLADCTQTRIMELRGTDGASPVQGRKLGFEEAIAEDSRFQIVWSESGDFNREGGRRVVQQYLEEHDRWDIDVIYAHNDDMALGAAEVLKENGIQPGTDVYILSIDGISDALDALRRGELNCVVECNPLLGPELMKAITDLMNGKELPLRIITDESVFTAETPAQNFLNRKY